MNVHCQDCNHVSKQTKEFTCSHCGSEDVFSAEDYVLDQIADITTSHSYGNKMKKLLIGQWEFVLSELRGETA